METETLEQEPKVGEEMRAMPYEPLLPVEKKLIGWSLALGVVLLIVLIIITRTYFPAG